MTRLHLVRTIEEVVDQYVSSRTASHPVSTSHALRAIRAALPSCTLSDRELTDQIAAVAVSRGRNVSFEGASERQ
jgi:hypothetical protein